MKKLYAICTVTLLDVSAIAMTKEVPSSRAKVFAAVKAETKRDVVIRSTPAMISASISQVDINMDGMPDYAVDYEKFSTPTWCGAGGCRYQLWLGQPGGKAKLVFDRMTHLLKMRKGANSSTFDFAFHGSNCGGAGSDPCEISFAWNAKSGKLVVVPGPGQKTAKHQTDAIGKDMWK